MMAESGAVDSDCLKENENKSVNISEEIKEPAVLRNLKIIDCFSNGEYGRIDHVRRRGTKEEYVIKYLDKARRVHYENEVAVMNLTKNKCAFLTQFHVAHEYLKRDKDRYCILTNYFEGEDLASILESYYIDTPAIVYIAFQYYAALEFLASLGITHRNLTTKNTILNVTTGKLSVIDFGLSKTTPTHTGFSGSIAYQAPEVLKHLYDHNAKPYDCRSDVYSFGCIIFELHYDATPLEFLIAEGVEKETAIRRLITGMILYAHYVTGNDLNFMFSLLHENPDRRMPVSKVHQHPFINFDVIRTVRQNTFETYVVQRAE